MTPDQLTAQVEAAHARRMERETMRPLARESARKAAQVAEEKFIEARLNYWKGTLK